MNNLEKSAFLKVAECFEKCIDVARKHDELMNYDVMFGGVSKFIKGLQGEGYNLPGVLENIEIYDSKQLSVICAAATMQYDVESICEPSFSFEDMVSVIAGENRAIVKLTGLPVSDELQSVLDRCKNNEYVDIDEIMSTPEMIAASSCVSYQQPTITLKNREEIQENVFRKLDLKGSVMHDMHDNIILNSNGDIAYNGFVKQGKRLDIVIGLPAAGKNTSIVEKISFWNQSKVIDGDEAKKLIPEYNGGWGATVVHREAQQIEFQLFLAALNRGDNIVLSKVGGNYHKLQSNYISIAKEYGYTVNLHYVSISRNVAMGRMLSRFVETGRYMEPTVIDKYVNRDTNKVEDTFEILKNSSDISGYTKWNNEVPEGDNPILLDSYNINDFFVINGGEIDEREFDIFNEGKSDELRFSSRNRENGRSNDISDSRDSSESAQNETYDRGGSSFPSTSDISEISVSVTTEEPLAYLFNLSSNCNVSGNEMIVKLEDGTEGYCYSIYDKYYRLVDGGFIEDDDKTAEQVMEEISKDYMRFFGEKNPDLIYSCRLGFPYEKHEDEIERINMVKSNFARKTHEKYHPEALNGLQVYEIINKAKDYILDIIDTNHMNVKMQEPMLVGSRCRGLENGSSDIDIVFEYESEGVREDHFFNLLNTNPLRIEGVKVDINPIRPEETGIIQDYLIAADDYLDKLLEKARKESVEDKAVKKEIEHGTKHKGGR